MYFVVSPSGPTGDSVTGKSDHFTLNNWKRTEAQIGEAVLKNGGNQHKTKLGKERPLGTKRDYGSLAIRNVNF